MDRGGSRCVGYRRLFFALGLLSRSAGRLHRIFLEQNRYGRPGKVLVVFCGVEILLFLIPKVWAKRANLFTAAVTLAYMIRCFILYTGCYKGICPERRLGIFLVLGGAVIALAASLLPDLSVRDSGLDKAGDGEGAAGGQGADDHDA